MSVDITAVPSKFAWRTSPRKRPPPSARFTPKKGKHRLEESFTEESFTISSDITSEADERREDERLAKFEAQQAQLHRTGIAKFLSFKTSNLMLL